MKNARHNGTSEKPAWPSHHGFGRSAALQMLAIAAAMSALCALQPIPNPGAPAHAGSSEVPKIWIKS